LTFDGTTLTVNNRLVVGTSAEYLFRTNPTTSLTSDGEYFGETITLGGNGTAENLYVWNDSNPGSWTIADANSVSGSIGLLGWNVSGGNEYLIRGYIKNTAWSWTQGVILYISSTAGAIQAVQPTGSGDLVRIVGFALSSDEIFFDPSQDWVTLV
jgi:hypothetical protein